MTSKQICAFESALYSNQRFRLESCMNARRFPMLKRTSNTTSDIDVLDHVLDKGIVIDAWISLSVGGIDLITVESRVVVASIETYLEHSHAIACAPSFHASGFANHTCSRTLNAERVAPVNAARIR